MMTQGVLPFQYEVEPSTSGLTGLAGLPVYFELAVVVGMRESIQRYVCARDGEQGWSDEDMILSRVLLNLAGGDCVDDIDKLAADVGLCKVLDEVRWSGLSKAQRRERARRWRRVARTRAVPSASSIRRYVKAFCSEESERPRPKGTSFIPAKTQALAGLGQVHAELVEFLQSHRGRRVATLDIDATMVECHKKQAQYGYKGFRAYQSFNVWWAEQQVVVHSEFRDGNVTPGYEQLRVLQEALAMLPEGVEQVHMRSDTAGYPWKLLRYCEEGRNERFGRIEFVVGVPIAEAFKQALASTLQLRWHPLADSDDEWAEVCYVPNELGRTKKGEYRFFVIREPVRQLELFDDDPQLPFPSWEEVTEQGGRVVWKLRAVVTNRCSTPAADVIQWYRDRCGKSEEAHAVMKNDLAGGRLPSKYFGANAAWGACMILAFNLNAVMKHLALGEAWVTQRMKAIPSWLINVARRVVRHARRLDVRLSQGHRSTELLLSIRQHIVALATGPPP